MKTFSEIVIDAMKDGDFGERTVASAMMVLHATTPHKFRYKAEDEESGVGDVYLNKAIFKGKPPRELLFYILS